MYLVALIIQTGPLMEKKSKEGTSVSHGPINHACLGWGVAIYMTKHNKTKEARANYSTLVLDALYANGLSYNQSD